MGETLPKATIPPESLCSKVLIQESIYDSRLKYLDHFHRALTCLSHFALTAAQKLGYTVQFYKEGFIRAATATSAEIEPDEKLG